MGKYGEAIGIWEIRIAGAEVDVTPQIDDSRALRNIMSEMKDKKLKFTNIENLLKKIIKRDNPDDDDKDIEDFVVTNFYPLMEAMMVKFKLTTEEKVKQAEDETRAEIKNLVLNV